MPTLALIVRQRFMCGPRSSVFEVPSRRTTLRPTTPRVEPFHPYFTFSGAYPLLSTMSKAVSTVDVMGESFLAGASVANLSHHIPFACAAT